MARGKAEGDAEAARREKISNARLLREQNKLLGIAPPTEESPPDPRAPVTHSIEEIRQIEKETGLRFLGWEMVGGRYRYEYRDARGNPQSQIEDAGLICQIPVFRRPA